MLEHSVDSSGCASEDSLVRFTKDFFTTILLFPEVVSQWDCLGTFPTTNAYNSCIQNFNQTVSAGNFCP